MTEQEQQELEMLRKEGENNASPSVDINSLNL